MFYCKCMGLRDVLGEEKAQIELEISERRKEHPVIGAVHLHAAVLSFLPSVLFVLSASLCMIHMRINKLNHICGKNKAAWDGTAGTFCSSWKLVCM